MKPPSFIFNFPIQEELLEPEEFPEEKTDANSHTDKDNGHHRHQFDENVQ